MSFREAFTKSKEQLLDYDDIASLYFGGASLLCILLPLGIYQLSTLISSLSGWKAIPTRSKAGHSYHYCNCSSCLRVFETKRKEARDHIWSPIYIIQFIIFLVLFGFFLKVVIALSTVSEIQAFNPFDILGIGEGSADKAIRKAYRTLSLRHHPDRNPNDPSSAAKFMLIAKAYQALTDETAKRNYEKYGNPDGPGAMKVGIGLPHFLVDERNQSFILALFLVSLILIIPFLFLLYYHQTKLYYPNGVRVDTVHFFGVYLNEQTRLRSAAEFLAASAESQEQNLGPNDLVDLVPLIAKIRDFKKPKFSFPIIKRNYILLLAHIQRLNNDVPLKLRNDLKELLRASPKITQSMIEIGFIHNWLAVVRSLVEFRRSLIQGLDVGLVSSLLQIPHFTPENVKQCSRHNPPIKNLREFLETDPEERPGISDKTDDQKMDLNEFCAHVSRMRVDVDVGVIGESEIVEGDVVTISVTLSRENLKTNQAAGPVHAPFFPDLQFEEWWLFLIETKSGGLQTYARALSRDQKSVEQLKFLIPRCGNWTFQLIAMCDSYDGIDIVKDIAIQALPRDQIKRAIYVHPDDEALENQPTLFQQMLGEIGDGHDDSSDEEHD